MSAIDEKKEGSSGSNQLNLLADRSAAYLAEHKYALALVDAESVLSVDSAHIECIFRKAKALIGLGEYENALSFLSELSMETISIPNQQIVTDLIVTSKSLLSQSQTGAYPWLAIFRNELVELAEFKGPVIVRNTQTKGRGLFATDAIKPGELIMGSKAFARFDDLIDSDESFVNLRTPSQLTTQIADILKENPEKCREVYDLYAGPEFSSQNPSIDGSASSGVDMKRIEAICFYNAFGNTSDGTRRTCGLWVSPSYINHSCVDGNSSWFIRGDFMFVVAFRDIAKYEEILISYVPATEEKTAFFEGHDFVCDCRLCIRDRQDDSTTKSKRLELMERFDETLNDFVADAMVPFDIVTTSILTSLNALRADAPELNLCHIDRIDSLSSIYLNNNQPLRVLNTLESVYDIISSISTFVAMSTNFCAKIVGAYFILRKANKVREWARRLKRNCFLAYGTWEVIEVLFPFTLRSLEELGIVLSEL